MTAACEVCSRQSWPCLEHAERTRRIGRWQYVRGHGWLLDGTGIVLDYDRLDGGCAIRGAWLVSTGPRMHEAIDHYLDGSMWWVEEHEEDYAC